MTMLERLELEVLRKSRERLDYVDVFDAAQVAGGLAVTHAGGGCVIHSPSVAEPIQVLHVFAHAGTRLVSSLEPHLRTRDEAELAEVILQNYDAGTPSLASELVRRLEKNQRSAVAVFEVARVFVDAFRECPLEVVPARLHHGDPPMSAQLTNDQRREIHDQLVVPWVDSISRILQGSPGILVIHHHSFDKTLNPRFDAPHVKDRYEVRKGAELLCSFPPGCARDPLVTSRFQKRAVEVLNKATQGLVEFPGVSIDKSYYLPKNRLLSNELVEAAKETLVYEFRKDLFHRHENVTLLADAIEEICKPTRGDARVKPSA